MQFVSEAPISEATLSIHIVFKINQVRALGAVVGGMTGAAVEEGATRQLGVEVTVRLDDGQYLAIVQGDQGENFRVGERVRVLRDAGVTRVAR